MDIYDVSVIESRQITKVVRQQSVETFFRTEINFAIKPVQNEEAGHYIIEFQSFKMLEAEKNDQTEIEDETAFSQSLKAFERVVFKIYIQGDNFEMLNGYPEFVKKVDKLYLASGGQKDLELPSSTFTVNFFRKLFKKVFFQIPPNLTDQSWVHDQQVKLLEKDINFETYFKITGFNENVVQITSIGSFTTNLSVYGHGGEIDIKGDFDGNVEFGRTSNLPKKIHYTLQMDVKDKTLKLPGIMLIKDSYTANFVQNRD